MFILHKNILGQPGAHESYSQNKQVKADKCKRKKLKICLLQILAFLGVSEKPGTGPRRWFSKLFTVYT